MSSQSSHHPQEVLLAQFSLYVHKGGLKPDSFHFHQHDIRYSESQCVASYDSTQNHYLKSIELYRLNNHDFLLQCSLLLADLLSFVAFYRDESGIIVFIIFI